MKHTAADMQMKSFMHVQRDQEQDRAGFQQAAKARIRMPRKGNLYADAFADSCVKAIKTEEICP